MRRLITSILFSLCCLGLIAPPAVAAEQTVCVYVTGKLVYCIEPTP